MLRRSLVILLLALLPTGVRAEQGGQRLEGFERQWERRDFHLVIFDEGFARARWKTGFCQPSTPPSEPCDRMVDGQFFYGGLAEMRFSEVVTAWPPKARGEVLLSNSTLFERGPITLIRFSEDLGMLEQPGHLMLWVCRPPRDVNTCVP
jgi:hypothetical protein